MVNLFLVKIIFLNRLLLFLTYLYKRKKKKKVRGRFNLIAFNKCRLNMFLTEYYSHIYRIEFSVEINMDNIDVIHISCESRSLIQLSPNKKLKMTNQFCSSMSISGRLKLTG
jgi:hypothetical protein